MENSDLYAIQYLNCLVQNLDAQTLYNFEMRKMSK